jgi:transcriptional antiterminator
MTLQEVAQKLGRSESTIYKNLKRTQDSLEKKGILLIKRGVDDYILDYLDPEDDETYLERLTRERKELREKEKGDK